MMRERGDDDGGLAVGMVPGHETFVVLFLRGQFHHHSHVGIEQEHFAGVLLADDGGAGLSAVVHVGDDAPVFLLAVEDQHHQRGFVHVKLVDQPLVRLPAEAPRQVSYGYLLDAPRLGSNILHHHALPLIEQAGLLNVAIYSNARGDHLLQT